MKTRSKIQTSKSEQTTRIVNAIIVTMNPKREIIRKGELRVRAGQIVEMGQRLKPIDQETVVDAKNGFLIPGLIQTHVHLCQTLFRGQADDLELLDWLTKKIWPFEANHTKKSLQASAQIGLMEMQLSGTTSILDMGTNRWHEVIFKEAERFKMRYWGGPCLMDLKSASGPLYRSSQEALTECKKLIEEWHLKTPLLQFAVSPRFVISCTEKTLKAAVQLQRDHNLIFHTHASENRKEVELVKKRTGMGNVSYLDSIGALNERSVIAHGVHLQNDEVKTFVNKKAGLAHCPSSNLKLASGIAPIHEYLKAGMKIGLGADGAPCNNSLDLFLEMRLSALLQKPLFGPTALPAQNAFELATLGGAKVLGCEDQVGSIEVGKRADLAIVARDYVGVRNVEDPYSALVYSCLGRDVSHVYIDGHCVVKDREHFLKPFPQNPSDSKLQFTAAKSKS